MWHLVPQQYRLQISTVILGYTYGIAVVRRSLGLPYEDTSNSRQKRVWIKMMMIL